MATEITLPFLYDKLEALEKEKQQLLDKIVKVETWQETVEKDIVKLKRIIGI